MVLLHRKVIQRDIGNIGDFPRARRGLHLPVVASRAEIKAVIERLPGREQLLARLLYGTGMRLDELLSLRVQEVRFDQHRIIVRAGKGDKGRYVPLLPAQLCDPSARGWPGHPRRAGTAGPRRCEGHHDVHASA